LVDGIFHQLLHHGFPTDHYPSWKSPAHHLRLPVTDPGLPFGTGFISPCSEVLTFGGFLSRRGTPQWMVSNGKL
jgi:hypothetical protein